MRSIIFWLIGISLPSLVSGQDTARWYQIEVLFLQNLASNAQHEELWPQRRQISRTAAGFTLPGASASTDQLTLTPTTGGTDSMASGSQTAARLSYTGVPSGERALAGANASLNQRSDYRVISYHAWRQALPADQKPLLFYVSSGDNYGPGPELEGFIEVSLKRFIHVDTELWWSQAAIDEDSINAKQPPTAHLVASRRMRSGETNYLDHPLIGVLVHITPLNR